MSGPSMGKTLDRYLQPGFAIRKVYEIVEPNLIFGDVVAGPVQEDKASFLYMYDDVGISGDTKKQTAPRFEVGGDLPRLDFSVPSTAAAITEAKGFEIAIPRALVRDGIAGEAALDRVMRRAGYILAEQINTVILAAMTGGATGSTTNFATSVAAGGVWSGADATPITDMTALAQDMDVEGYPYRLTDVFMNKAGFYELKDYLNFVDGDQFSDQRITGQMINRDTIYVKQADVTCHKVMSGLTDSNILGVDMNNPGGELHVYNDPAFALGSPAITYKTIENGKSTTKTAPNVGIHFYSYMEDDTKNTVLQYWFENKTAITQPLALQYVSGI